MAVEAAKQRTLLTILLVHANEVVPTDLLIEELWSEPPKAASNALQVYVGKLRKALEPQRPSGAPGEALVTRAPGYMLPVESDQLDAHRFEHLLIGGRRARADGDDAGAAWTLREALDLWRGPALSEFTYEPFAQAEIARLEDLRLVAVEERLDAELALGRHAELIGELEALRREHPLRERLRGQLMLALYRSGRQAEALDVYRDTHRTLVDELGIIPGSELQYLEEAILRQDPELELPTERRVEPAPTIDVPEPVAETRKPVSVLVAHTNAPSGSDSETFRTDEHHAEAAVDAIERHGGSVESLLGDSIVGVFGIPFAHEDDALRAARAAAELGDGGTANETPEPGRPDGPATRIGIATGEVTPPVRSGTVAEALEEPLALAARLADAASPGETLLAGATRGLLGDAALVDLVEAPPGAAWRLGGLAPDPPPLAEPLRAPLVGRLGELDQLRQAFERAVEARTPHLFTILGVAGVGKSRLARELTASLAEEATVLAGRCAPYGEGITFWALEEIVRQLAGTGAISDLLEDEPQADLVARRVAEAIGTAAPSSSREEIFWAVARLFEALARRRPLVLVFEDIHWAEPSFLDLIEYLAERGREAPILLLCLAREELLEKSPAWGGGKRNAATLLLEPLGESECDALIDGLIGGLPEATRARALEVAEGNPLFLEQIVAMLADPRRANGELPIPATIQALLASRLDRLGPGERGVIERAAVVGREFWPEAVADLLPEAARPLTRRHLDALARKELVHPAPSDLPGQEAFRFGHTLIQQVIYRAIPEGHRAALHERVAAWFERSAEEVGMGREEIAGYHLERAVYDRTGLGAADEEVRETAAGAAERLAAAGERAFSRGDTPAAVNLLERATALLPDGDRARVKLLPDLGFALFEDGEPTRAREVLTEAIEGGRASGDRAVQWRARAKLDYMRMYTERELDPERLAHDAGRALEVLEEVGDEVGMAMTSNTLAEARWMTGDLLGSAGAAERAAEHASRAGNRREEALAIGQLAWCVLHGPTRVAEGARRLERIRDDAASNPVLEVIVSGFLAVHGAMRGEVEDARAEIGRCRTLTRDLGLRWEAGELDLLSSYVELLAGHPTAAERDMREARDAFEEIGDRWFLATVAVDLPRAVYEQGRPDDALPLVEAIDDEPAPADREWQVKRRGIRARLLAESGEPQKAVSLAREAVALAADSDFLWLHANVLTDLAATLRAAGQPEEARAADDDATRLHQRKGNLVSARVARTPAGGS